MPFVIQGDNDPRTGRTTYTYDEVGNLRGYAYPNGVNSFYSYNALNRLTNMNVSTVGGTVANYAYAIFGVITYEVIDPVTLVALAAAQTARVLWQLAARSTALGLAERCTSLSETAYTRS
jgi:YD repeat-containing protein